MSKSKNAAQLNGLASKRHRLAKRIEEFHQRVSGVFDGIEGYDEILSWSQWEDQDGTSTEDEGGSGGESDGSRDSTEDGVEGDESLDLAETTILCLPSSFSKQDISTAGLEWLASQEMELRKGQANDSLEALKMVLAHKALLLRHVVRNAKSSHTRTRAWDKVKLSGIELKKHARAYNRTRQAMVNLGVDDDSLKFYQKITTRDLGVSGDIVEENRLGQRSETLAWFWRLGHGHSSNDNVWMNECKSIPSSPHCTGMLTIVAVYRVTWLRSKARFTRWAEEVELVQNEMGWTELWFKHQEQLWATRAQAYGDGRKPGHEAYAHKQRLMWADFYSECQRLFSSCLQV